MTAAGPQADQGPARARLVAVTVLGNDRPGIVAEVAAALAGVEGNLEDSTMTLLRGHFAMVVLVRTAADDGAVQEALRPLTVDGTLRVDARALAEDPSSAPTGPAYALSVHGADRPGIVAAVTRVVADHGGNIVDLGTRLGGTLYVLTVEFELPASVEVGALERDLQGVAAGLGVGVHLTAVDAELL